MSRNALSHLSGRLRFAGGALLVLCTCVARAQAVPPSPLELAEPEPPEGRSGMPMEGWIIMRYSVLADGTTDRVRAVDRVPRQLPDRTAIAAVESWTFEPATADGVAVEWHNNEAMLVFDVPEIPFEPNPAFVTAYQAVDALIQAEEYEEALDSSERMMLTQIRRLADMGVAYMQNALIHVALGNTHAAYSSILRATDPRITLLDQGDLAVALQYRNVLELQHGDMYGALATLERRQQLGPVAEDDPMASRVDAIEEALAGEAAIAIRAKILGENWRHTLSRRTFAMAPVDGGLSDILVECERRSAELEFAEDSEWTLPDSWGQCELTVEGRRDTEFVYYEFQ